MRKRYRVPGRATCTLCKPEKMGWHKRGKTKEEVRLRLFEQERTYTRWQHWREEATDRNH